MQIKLSSILFFAIIAFSSCKTQYDMLLESYDTAAKYKAAFGYFEAKQYSKAATLFESLSLATKGTLQEDTVQFYWALSNYNYGDYFTAESNFDQFLMTFPRSTFSVEAKYLRIDCLFRKTFRYELDQVPTYKALQAIEDYLYQEQNSPYYKRCVEMQDVLNERLDKKAFESARLYYHMEDYLAAHYAFKNVLKDDAENRYREDILYYTALSAFKYASLSVREKQRERYMVFVDDYFNFVGEFSDSAHKKELDSLYKKAQAELEHLK